MGLYVKVLYCVSTNQSGRWLASGSRSRFEIYVTFFDICKAFNRVPHVYLRKLDQLGLDKYLVQWIRSYLSERSQLVSIDGINSHTLLEASGVPQGSVLGPLLFIPYINLMMWIPSHPYMFADDVALYWIIRSTMDYTFLQNYYVHSISDSVRSKHLWFNTSKCKNDAYL